MRDFTWRCQHKYYEILFGWHELKGKLEKNLIILLFMLLLTYVMHAPGVTRNLYQD